MSAENEVAVAPPVIEVSTSIQAAYDRIANPEKENESQPVKTEAPHEEPPKVEHQTAETPPEAAFTSEQIKDLMARVSRIPDLEKGLRDAGGRYGAIKQSLDQLQQRMTTASTGNPAEVEEMLAGIKEDFGDDSSLYQSLKIALTKMSGQRAIDPSAIETMVAEKISQAKQAEIDAAENELTEAHPSWREDTRTPHFAEYMETLSARDRSRLQRSNDPDFVSDKLDSFYAWKAAKEARPATPTAPPAQKQEQPTSRRVMNAILPTQGAKPKPNGEADKETSIRAAYQRIAGSRMR